MGCQEEGWQDLPVPFLALTAARGSVGTARGGTRTRAARRRASLGAAGFIAHYLFGVIYPAGLTRGMQAGLGVLVLLVAIIGYWGVLRRHARGEAWREHWPSGRPTGRRADRMHKRAVRP